MHELGVAFHIADKVVEVAKENDVKHVHSVTLQIGEVSTVVPEYLVDVWNWNCKRVPILNSCMLKVEKIHAISICGDCNKQYDTVPQGKICPFCHSENTWLVTGNEVDIKEIEVE